MPTKFHEAAPLYALGALDLAEAAPFEEHLDQGCAACEAELRGLAQVTDALAETAAMTPPPSLRARALARMEKSPPAAGTLFERDGLLISRSAELPWSDLSPGIACKALYSDGERDYDTMLVRMDAGADTPPTFTAASRSCSCFRATFTWRTK